MLACFGKSIKCLMPRWEEHNYGNGNRSEIKLKTKYKVLDEAKFKIRKFPL